MTLQELKQSADHTEEEGRLPTARYLKDNEEELAKIIIGKDVELTVYRNGYAAYQDGKHTTVFPIWSCGNYCYKQPEGNVEIGESFFGGQEWHLRLLLEGEDRLSHNEDVRERDKTVPYCFERDHNAGTEQSLQEKLILRETVSGLLDFLTERQRKVVVQFYLCQKTQREIAAELGVSIPSVNRTLSRAIQRMKRRASEDVRSAEGGVRHVRESIERKGKVCAPDEGWDYCGSGEGNLSGMVSVQTA